MATWTPLPFTPPRPPLAGPQMMQKSIIADSDEFSHFAVDNSDSMCYTYSIGSGLGKFSDFSDFPSSILAFR
jgi:hypothetical protein